MAQRHDVVPLAPVDRPGGWALSFGQQRLWFLNQLLPDSPFYHVSSMVRLSGALDVDALARAIGEIAARHEMLRCRIAVVNGTPLQFPGEPPELEMVDAGGVDGCGADGCGEAALERAREVLSERSRRLFDLERDPPLRMCLARLSAREHLLGVTFHHIAADAWSFGVFYGELSQLYEAFAAGRPSPLPALAVQYGDFAVWQRQRLSQERLAAELDFWRRELAGAPLAMELPMDRPRPKVASYAGAAVPLCLDAELTAALRRVSRQQRATLFMVLLAAFGVLLTRWTGQADMLVGVPTAGRARRDLTGLIGFFVNTVAVRLRCDGDPAFTELVRRVCATALDVFSHQDLPFEMVVDDLSPERDLGRNPLVQVMFQLENTRPGEAVHQARWEAGHQPAAGVDVRWLTGDDRTTTHFDLSVTLTEAEGGLLGELTYATELFDEHTARRVAAWYLRILRLVAADPMVTVSELTLADRAELAPRAADPGADSGPGATIGELFAAQAGRTPQAPAVACGDRSLTYAQLWSRASGLARELRRLGVGPEVTAGVCAERGVELIVAIMGVVLAGGAYVPVDPESPAERAALVLDDAAVRVVVSTRRVAKDLAFAGRPVVYADDAVDADPAWSPLPEPAATPDNLLNVVYTSGSTGQPKGVMVRHAHVADYVTWCLEHLPVKPGGSVPLTSSVSFAGVTLALFGALLSGRRLVVPDPGDPLSWCAGEQEYSFVKLTPSTLRAAWHRYGRCWDRWGCVILASEPVRRTDWELVRSAPGVTAVIHYGSTETNGSTVWWPPTECDPASRRRLPIGRPVSSARVLVLDHWGDPVPPGVPGEVFIGGPSVARGYLGQPALTAERFVPDPFGPPGSRMFRTGDLARLAPDGTLEFLGRGDRQVKIRGYRVELDGLEQELKAVDGVADAAVTTVPDPAGGLALAACAVPAPTAELTAEGLRGILVRRLPSYLVPARLAIVASLPRTTSGKIDHRLLAAAIPAAQPQAGDPPHTPDEQAMAAIWAQVLKIPEPGRDDNFFSLGGHSLLAIQILARVQEVFGVELPLQAIFEDPTIAGLSRCLNQAA